MEMQFLVNVWTQEIEIFKIKLNTNKNKIMIINDSKTIENGKDDIVQRRKRKRK